VTAAGSPSQGKLDATSRSLLRVERLNYLLGGILCVAALIGYPGDISLGVAVGVALTCLNFAFLRRLVFRWTTDAAAGQGSSRIALVLPKMIGLMLAVVLSLLFLPINAVAFAVGYSIFVISIVIESLYSALAPTPPTSGGDDGAPQNPDEPNHG